MYKYLLVILEKGAVPFCYYDNPHYYSLARPVFMPAKTLERVIRHARKNGLFINFLYGKHRPPAKHEELIAAVGHVKMIPLELKDVYADAVLVLESDECEAFAGLEDDFQRNIILRVNKRHLPELPEIFESLHGKFKRLNVHLVGQEDLTLQDMDVYENQLGKMAKVLRQRYRSGEEIEVNVLSDRILLGQMNNCDAGLKHLTVAPNGKCYICPGFYHDDEANAVFDFGEGLDKPIDNQRLLDIGCAPICSTCDAFQCKRCVYLNKKTTLEINTPSEQQCLVSHIERDISRQLLGELQDTKPFDRMTPIPDLTHRDPFTVVVRSRWHQPAPDAKTRENPDSGDYLTRIYEMQKRILRKLEAD